MDDIIDQIVYDFIQDVNLTSSNKYSLYDDRI